MARAFTDSWSLKSGDGEWRSARRIVEKSKKKPSRLQRARRLARTGMYSGSVEVEGALGGFVGDHNRPQIDRLCSEAKGTAR